MKSKLTKPEKEWLAKMQKLLDACPSERFAFYATGDPTVGVFDATKEQLIYEMMEGTTKDFPPTVDEAGALLGSLEFPNQVSSVAS